MLDFTKQGRLDHGTTSKNLDEGEWNVQELTICKVGSEQACLCRPVICDFVAGQDVNGTRSNVAMFLRRTSDAQACPAQRSLYNLPEKHVCAQTVA